MEKKRTATVFDMISKRKISIQVPHTEIVRWLVSRSQLDEICLFVHSKWIRMFVDLFMMKNPMKPNISNQLRSQLSAQRYGSTFDQKRISRFQQKTT